jgi:hypothetical protein
MADLSKVLPETVVVDEEQFKEMITQNSLVPNAYNSDLLFSPDYEEEDEDEDDELGEEDEDLFDEEEPLEEEGYEEDFDFDEEEEADEGEADLGKFS